MRLQQQIALELQETDSCCEEPMD
uniref:Uncharacterized protein n=1 Tax=Arundo donax TaxID=35708 RepID=A0A0A9ED76_ARUDO